MAIPESQLVTWMKLGATDGLSSTYGMIQNALQDPSAPFSRKRASPFLQGSYGNQTYIRGVVSDVDIVYVMRSVAIKDIGRLGTDAYLLNIFNDTENAAAQIELQRFKAEVATWLGRKYGSDVSLGSKAIKIERNGDRRKTDVLPCVEFRRYRPDSNGKDAKYDPGVCFLKSDGSYIANFPHHHQSNGQKKHQDTGDRFKPLVRIFKNMRNRLVDEGKLRDGVAPSYFIEGLIYNYPTPLFTGAFTDLAPAAMRWLWQADPSRLMCANGLDPMFGPNPDLSWKIGDYTAYLTAVSNLWNDWGRGQR